ncbi:MAG TPA: succinylglutamate desuccinylase/aspartoacylase family protein [Pararhizobium sp.]|nr:succinylglutamate desuccinylase/aspartoacylase family protein [Pararhizobium sp.]
MTREVFDVALGKETPGTAHTVPMVRFGAPGARPKAYIHAALHADEAPGLMVAHHLLRLLDEAEAKGEIRGQVIVVPFANPLGLGQFVHGDHLGRFDLASGRNFNRGWPDISSELIDRVGGRLGSNEEENGALIRRAIGSIFDERGAAQEVDALYLALAREAFDADLVLDLHCDDEGLMHMFVRPEQWPALRDIASELQCRAVFAEKPTGGGTFAEAAAIHWLGLAAAYPDKPIPAGGISATVELRGFIDVDDEVTAADAAAIMNALRRRGYLEGSARPAPEPLCEATAFEACDVVRTPVFGVIAYRAQLGERVTRGQPIADIVTPSADGTRTTIRSRTDGIVVTRRLKKLVAPNQVIAKVVGSEPLAHRRGYLLED